MLCVILFKSMMAWSTGTIEDHNVMHATQRVSYESVQINDFPPTSPRPFLTPPPPLNL